jgi:hypothetical protein
MAYDNAEQVYHVTDLDSLTPIGRTLKKGGSAIDGSTLTLQTKLVADDGTVVSRGEREGAVWFPERGPDGLSSGRRRGGLLALVPHVRNQRRQRVRFVSARRSEAQDRGS